MLGYGVLGTGNRGVIGKSPCHLVSQRLVEKVVVETNGRMAGLREQENVSMIRESLHVVEGFTER